MNKRSRYDGMTIEQRLFAAGLFEAFQIAVTRRDRLKMMQLLFSVDVDDPREEAERQLRDPRCRF
jgi:hypothetical protein